MSIFNCFERPDATAVAIVESLSNEPGAWSTQDLSRNLYLHRGSLMLVVAYGDVYIKLGNGPRCWPQCAIPSGSQRIVRQAAMCWLARQPTAADRRKQIVSILTGRPT